MSRTAFDISHGAKLWTTVGPLRPLAISVGLIVLWEMIAATVNTAQFGDNVEQFNWAQSLELGYHKHPPLPSWLLGCILRVGGPSIYWSYVLTGACLIGAVVFTWLLARQLVGPVGAAAAALLCGLNMSFAQRAQLYNHNTVLLPLIAGAAWFAYRASSAATRRSLLWWTLTGTSAAGALLSKYQALVPLAGLLLALGATGRLDAWSNRLGLAIAAGVMLVLCAPHVLWMVANDYSTLRYASEAVADSNVPQRFGFLASFVANQARLWSAALLVVLVLSTVDRYRSASRQRPTAISPSGSSAGEAGRWLFGLLWFGLVVLAVMALGLGVSLRNHWGVQALQFFGLWLISRWRRNREVDLRRLTWAVLVVHAVNMAWYVAEHRSATAVVSNRRIDTSYPAQRLADAAVTHWRSHVDCQLRYVAGTAFDAGLVSLYSGGRLRVFDSKTATPWIKPEQLRAHGAIYVLDGTDAVPPGVTDLIEFPLTTRNSAPETIRIGLLHPDRPCADGKAAY